MNEIIPKKTPYEATLVIFKSLTKIGAWLLSLAGFAYLIGWFQASAYFRYLGASWILNDMSTLSIISYSWIPLLVFVFFLYLGLWDISQARTRKVKADKTILKYSISIMILLIVINFIFQNLELVEIYRISTIFLIVFYFFYAIICMHVLITELQEQTFKWNTFINALIYGIVIFGLYQAPTKIGEFNAQEDIDLKLSKLPQVIMKTHLKEDIRLLYNIEDISNIIMSYLGK